MAIITSSLRREIKRLTKLCHDRPVRCLPPPLPDRTRPTRLGRCTCPSIGSHGSSASGNCCQLDGPSFCRSSQASGHTPAAPSRRARSGPKPVGASLPVPLQPGGQNSDRPRSSAFLRVDAGGADRGRKCAPGLFDPAPPPMPPPASTPARCATAPAAEQ